jgi:hypothetical protein
MQYESSLKLLHAFVDPETSKALSVPVAALIAGALSQVEATIDSRTEFYDSVFHAVNQGGDWLPSGSCDERGFYGIMDACRRPS